MVRILAAWLLLIGSAAAQERVDVQSRPGVTQSVFITAVANPNASVLLFPGGSGVYARSRNNFLLRIAPQFTAAGMMVAVFDTPSGHPKWHGAVIPCVYATCRGYCGHSGVAEEQDICAAVVGWDQQWLDIGGRGGGCRRASARRGRGADVVGLAGPHDDHTAEPDQGADTGGAQSRWWH
jgi:hypothetical protein